MTDQEKIHKVLELSFKIDNAIFYYQPSVETIEVYTIKDGKVELDFQGYIREWSDGSDRHIDSMIKKMEEYIKSKGE